MKGLYQQIREGNIHSYSDFSRMTFLKAMDELGNTERYKLSLILDKLHETSSIETEQYDNIKLLLYSDNNYNVNLAKEIIKKLKNN